MSDFRRRLIMAVAAMNDGEIPAGCVRCEYIESYVDASNANGQWIDTERILTDTDEFSITIMAFANSADKSAFGWRWTGTYVTGNHCLINTMPVGKLLFALGINTNGGIRYDLNTKYTFVINPNTKKITVNDAFINTSNMDWTLPYNNGTSDVTVPLFVAKNPNLTSGSNCRIYDYWVKDKEGNYLQHLVPILDKNGVPCMYDTVNKKYHYNQRTNRTDNFRYEIL